MSKIIYTKTDEAPALATVSLLPIIQAFTKSSGVEFETRDISLSSRILATFNDYLGSKIKYENDLEFLSKLVKDPDANIIKLPNISASIPQLKKAISELQSKGFKIPNYPDKPDDENQLIIKSIYDKIKGSAVNPVLREGNSDRRVPDAIKNYIKSNPHKLGKWSSNSKTHVSSMKNGDFKNNEKSLISDRHELLNIYHYDSDNKKTILKENITIHKGAIIDCSFMSIKSLQKFIEQEIFDCKSKNLLFSLHLKASMMKVSDPIIFGHVLKVFFKRFIKKNDDLLKDLNVNLNSGLSNLYDKINGLEKTVKEKLFSELEDEFNIGPEVAMVNSENNITNFHIPSDVIIDASMPAMIKSSGKMWNKKGELKDTKAVIPDSSYASIYQATIDFCKKHGEFDPSTMGTVQNVGLMAKKAEEYGSHDKTFEIKESGKVCVETKDGKILFTHDVMIGDIWRMCIVRNEAINDWINLAIKRAETTKYPTVFWLDQERSHDKQLIKVVKNELKKLDISSLDIQILSPYEATVFTLKKIKKGENVISVSGNVLRDYLTDLFPILELGTSAKMLSIVPLMNGGKLFETGAGGSAPKHVQQLNDENHLRWDSLGEFLAISVALENIGIQDSNSKILSECLTNAIEKLLKNHKSPSRKVGEIDNRGSHFYLALFWAEFLSIQNKNISLKEEFSDLYKVLSENEKVIIDEINENQGNKIDLNGYYKTDDHKTKNVMRPSKTLNLIIDNL
ncbi:MAG: NADP-dependent isocitrate dehydrogenase [Flavobacteriaceae bacterium]|nr:NADP-dependent isocitrate dehydrogenase [Flavobacteriaceae bacterium]